jgi:hypothetical protein
MNTAEKIVLYAPNELKRLKLTGASTEFMHRRRASGARHTDWIANASDRHAVHSLEKSAERQNATGWQWRPPRWSRRGFPVGPGKQRAAAAERRTVNNFRQYVDFGPARSS